MAIIDMIRQYLEVYSYLTIYCVYFIELMGIPVPGETTMVYIGYLSWAGRLSWPLCILAVTCGAISGVTGSYFIGLKIGSPLMQKYGRFIGLTPERFGKIEEWIAVYGKKILIIAYYIPGLRHASGYVSGILEIPYPIFAANAYSGALLYAVSFTSLGYFLGPGWERALNAVRGHIAGASLLLMLVMLAYFIWKYKKKAV